MESRTCELTVSPSWTSSSSEETDRSGHTGPVAHAFEWAMGASVVPRMRHQYDLYTAVLKQERLFPVVFNCYREVGLEKVLRAVLDEDQLIVGDLVLSQPVNSGAFAFDKSRSHEVDRKFSPKVLQVLLDVGHRCDPVEMIPGELFMNR